jgi:hypothetical protein
MEISVDILETPALTKAQLAEILYQPIGLNKRESKDMIEAFFDLITQSLVEVATSGPIASLLAVPVITERVIAHQKKPECIFSMFRMLRQFMKEYF